ncbi:MAG: M48 family metallopeptidase [Candidatus Protistobacter heckmanni]|nr:M48 family metallopeptidase [Candidatus Protistobacter heckmanni]
MPIFTLVFVAALLLSLAARLWLASRQLRHVAAHRNAVPAQFSSKVDLAQHQHAADYTLAKTRLGMLNLAVGAVVLVGLTLLGGLEGIAAALRAQLAPGYVYDLALLGSVLLVTSVIDLPFSLYSQFRVEERFGFNRMTLGLFFVDMLKGLLVGLILGAPLALAVLCLMNSAGGLWWLWAWGVWMGFNLLLLVFYPTVIAPIFNKFEPLIDEGLKQRIESLLQRCGFASKGVFVMDGSKRSSHGNAYFTGFGAAKRIVFFDTLMQSLTPSEIEAVLAHELGHFHHKHVTKRIIATFAVSLGMLALLGWLSQQVWFYVGLGVTPALGGAGNNALALILFFLAMPVFSFFFTPLSNLLSRKHEFEADSFAASQTDAHDLISALVKLVQDNASTLTPDPLYTALYASHPPAAIRIAHLEKLA